MVEREFYQPLCQGAALEGIVLWRIPDGSAATPCDLFGVLPGGKALIVEVKRVAVPSSALRSKTEKLLRPHQAIVLRAAARRGAAGLLLTVVHSGKALAVWCDLALSSGQFRELPDLTVVREGGKLKITGWKAALGGTCAELGWQEMSL